MYYYPQQATIMLVKPNNDGGQDTNIKGRLNFGTIGSGPSHIITLSDSNFPKTIAAMGNRPPNDPNDAFIGYDNTSTSPSNTGITFGAPLSLSNYIGNVGDGKNWKERLTSTLKTFNTDVQINGNLVVNGQVVYAEPASAQLSGATNRSEVQSSTLHQTLSFVNAPNGIPRSVRTPQQLTYTVAANEDVSSGSGTPWVYRNRSAKASVNLIKGNSSLLASDLVCSVPGSATSKIQHGASRIVIGDRLEHSTKSVAGARRITVVITYIAE
jgi:hypothetical protein